MECLGPRKKKASPCPKLQEILSDAAKTPALFLDLMPLGVELRKSSVVRIIFPGYSHHYYDTYVCMLAMCYVYSIFIFNKYI